MATVTFDINQELQLTTFIVHGDISLTEIQRSISSFHQRNNPKRALGPARSVIAPDIHPGCPETNKLFLKYPRAKIKEAYEWLWAVENN
jgi:hypothetical protein